MRKRIFSVILLCLLCVLLCSSAFADVSDEAGLLSDYEQSELESMISDFLDAHGFQLVILTVNGTDSRDITDIADDFYDNGGYCDDGALFAIDIAERAWYISTAGRGEYALTDTNIDFIAEEMLPFLKTGDYFEAFSIFIEECGYWVDAYDSGEFIPEEDDYADYGDYGYREEPHTRGLSPLWIPVSIAIGVLLALLITSSMKSGMNSVQSRKTASDYANRGSLKLTDKQDVFLYHTILRAPKPKDDSGTRGGGGGSFGGGIHMSGGGVSHGGHGGHF